MRAALFFIFFILLWSNISYSRNVTQIYVNDLKWPPFFFPALEGDYTGFGRDVINTCLAKMNYEAQLIPLPLKRIQLYMESGDIDVTTFSYKLEREKFLHYGNEPLFITQYGFASKKSDGIDIQSLDDIKKYTLGHLAGLAHTPEILKIIENKKQTNEVSIGYDIDSMYGQMLTKAQRFQVMINSKETLIWRAKQLNVLEQIKVHDYVVKEKPYFVTVSKKSKHIQDGRKFLDKIDKCIIELKESGKYQELAAPYGLYQLSH